MNVVIAGASGFVGAHVLTRLAREDLDVIALSRSPQRQLPAGVTSREVDLFSAQSTIKALSGATTAIYLVHSMMPSSSLFQGTFHDTDLLLADNFARACVAQGVKQIIYLGGIFPMGHVSQHLESRHEVEEVLRATGIPLTALRAGMIVGPGGSSFEILHSLVQRLPFLVLPAWTQRATQAIFIDDIVEVIAQAVMSEAFRGRTLDVVNGEALIYETLLREMGKVLGLSRRMLRVPIQSTEFSKLWVTLFGDADYELVSPLIDCLLCDLPASVPDPLIAPSIRYGTFRAMAEETLARTKARPRKRSLPLKRRQKTVRSIQRLPSLPALDCHSIATEYMRWLPHVFKPLLHIAVDETSGRVVFRAVGLSRPLLELEYIQSGFDQDRKKFHIVGGLLSATRDTGWLEFRQLENKKYTLSAIHEFVPSLPWWFYRLTQAPLHAWVMRRFGRHLRRPVE